ncbi:unnamed protein product [Tuber melanosporum]|uniref:(Perigord truffle) hypothetical protein n=1 Tax=Tuber melanosporum (strain Mel28) TaxID=656061 RepID=D5GC25_TUBMM|nr:uncharacterized protein GSTUM_00005787001 [Tuber melanosporum]CAZ82068.1 unnamed protein product [Tuber melanosporum]
MVTDRCRYHGISFTSDLPLAQFGWLGDGRSSKGGNADWRLPPPPGDRSQFGLRCGKLGHSCRGYSSGRIFTCWCVLGKIDGLVSQVQPV